MKPDPLLTQIDGLLVEIAGKESAVKNLEASMAAAVARATAGFAPHLSQAKEDLKAIEAELVGLAKHHKAALFEKRDRVDLPHGALIRQVQRRVKRIKGMLDRLKAARLPEAIKVSESVDWDTIEKWDAALLAKLGTKRVPKELFSYETAGGK